jgi:hypothetical protein
VKIISGGQTGIDRAALDIALERGIESGGWCPTGRLDEFGRIPDRYPLKELENGGFTERTLQNVKDSDGTVIMYPGKLSGGTEQTVRFCVEHRRPHELIDACKISAEKAAQLIADFVRENKIDILNVAGPRQSEWPEGYSYASRALEIFLNSIASKAQGGDKITRSATPSPDRAARRSTRESAQQSSR